MASLKQSNPVQGKCGSTLVNFVYILVFCSLVIINLCPLISQCSSSFSSISAPAGNHLTQHPGQSASFPASHVPARGQDSESPGSRLPPSGPDGFDPIGPGFVCRKPASNAGASDTPPDQDASVSISHFTGMHRKTALFFHIESCFCRCVINCTYYTSIGGGLGAPEESDCEQSSPGAHHPLCVCCSQTSDCLTRESRYQPCLSCCAPGCDQPKHQTGEPILTETL